MCRWVGTLGLAVPLGVASVWWRSKLHGALPEDAMAHIIVAWAVGGLMAYLAEGYRREVFASKLRAKVGCCLACVSVQVLETGGEGGGTGCDWVWGNKC